MAKLGDIKWFMESNIIMETDKKDNKINKISFKNRINFKNIV